MKILQIDIETAPNQVYTWGLFKQDIALNQIVAPGYTLCFAAKWLGQKEIIFESEEGGNFDRMIQRAWDLLNEADAVIHYNGKKFDIPTLNKEFMLAGLPPPDPYHQIDLYRTIKSRTKFASNKLDFVCQQLGLGGKVHHKGMQLWNDCMNNDPKAWATMRRYNMEDVRLLERLYKKVLPWISNHPNRGLYVDTTKPVCPNCGSTHLVKKGIETTATQQYQRYRCKKCETPLRGRLSIVPKDKKAAILTQSKQI
jgi:DNA polymerase elongation subunit (family B)/predicted RNA-binding Zn-ribbon protein involved in translation (DUF1610 family)